MLERARPPVEPGPQTNRATFSDGESPGGLAAPPINFLSSVTNGLQTGAIPANWMGGVCHTPAGCDSPEVWVNERDPLNVEGEPMERPALKTINDPPGDVESWAFDIPMGISRCWGTEAEVVAAAIAELEDATPAAMARYLHAKLRVTAAALPGGTPVSVPTGVSMLFEARGVTGPGGGVLHVPDRAVASAVDRWAIVRGGVRYTSPWGSPVTVGPGLSPDGPDGDAEEDAADGFAWLWITGNVDYALGPVDVLSTKTTTTLDMGRQNRTVSALVERRAIIRFNDCDAYAVRVELG